MLKFLLSYRISMKFLRKILLALGIILLLACLKPLLRKFFPVALPFHFNLLSALQLLVLFWAVITGLLESTLWRRLPHHRARIRSTFFFIFLMCLTETGAFLLLHHPRLIPAGCLPAFQYYYNNYERNILQYDPHISRYDSTLFYRMKGNNRSLFSNIEFSDSLFTDTQGFRDSDNTNTLSQPAILCLGDSYTLGWGVGQEECYPSRLQKLLGVPVLNTGMSSYGTAREVASIKPLDKTKFTAVVIQYCFNDADENEAFTNNGFRLPVSPRSTYDSAVASLRWSRAWFPGKYACTLFKLLMTGVIASLTQKTSVPDTTQPGQYDREAARFLEVLKRSGLDFTTVRVFVFDIREYPRLSGNFIAALERQLAVPLTAAAFNGHIQPLHIERLFTADDYYRLDEHLRPAGQLRLAKFLAAAIQRSN
jgi:hypothetical protein